MKQKKNVIVHFNNITPEVLEALRNKYPDGYQDHVFKVTKPNNDFFYGITVDTEDTSYLIKVDVKIDNATDEKLAEQLFAKDDIPEADIKGTDEDENEHPDKAETKGDDDF